MGALGENVIFGLLVSGKSRFSPTDMAGKSRELGNLVPGKFSHLEGNL